MSRHHTLGHQLVDRLIEEARGAEYSEIRLDVLAEFTRAQKLYAEFGFVAAEAVSYNPLPDTVFLGLTLK